MSERFEITFSEGGVGLIETLATGGLAVVAEKTMDAVSGNDNHGWYCTIKDTVTQISVKCWGSSKGEAQEKSFEEIKRKIEDREDELEREIADIKQREDNALRQRNEQKRETPLSNHGSSSDENGCLKIIVYIVLIIGAIALAIWLAVNIVLPVTLLNSALIFTILALVFKQQKVLFAILALLGGGYMMMDILNGWFSLSFIENVVKDSTWISVFVYLNAIALGIATFLLVWPLWEKSKLTEDSQKGKSILLKITMALIVVIGVVSMPLIYQFIEKPFDSIKQSTEIKASPEPVETVNNASINTSQSYTVISDKAYFYEQSNLDTRKKAYLINGEKFETTTIENDFAYVEFTNAEGVTTIGWIRLADVTINLENNNSSGLYRIATDRAYFYTQPNSDFRKKAYLVNGEEFNSTITENGFAYVEFTNSEGVKTIGWIRLSDVTK